MKGSGTGFTKLRFVAEKQQPPYKVEKGLETQQVKLFDFTATYVGIAKSAGVGPGDFIVSDSVGPCVPVVCFERNACSLAHCNGTGGIYGYAAQWDKQDASILVIGKVRECKQRQFADEILANLTSMGFKLASMCVVPTSARIGVIVRYDTVLMYNQE